MTQLTEGRQVKQFGLLTDGALIIINSKDFDGIKECEQYCGSHSIIWLNCYNNNIVVASYNTMFLTFIEWEYTQLEKKDSL